MVGLGYNLDSIFKKSYLPKNSMKLVQTLEGEGQDRYLPNETAQTYHLLTLS